MASIVKWPSFRCQLPTEVRIIDGTSLVQGGHIAIAASTFPMRFIVHVEVIATRETTSTPRYPADMGSVSQVVCQMTSKGLSTVEVASAS
jgi:hypothetical protein